MARTETKSSGQHRQTITLLDLRSHEPYEVGDRTGRIMVVTDPTQSRTLTWGRLSLNVPYLALDDVVGIGVPMYDDYQHLFHSFQQDTSTTFLAQRAILLKKLMGLPFGLRGG